MPVTRTSVAENSLRPLKNVGENALIGANGGDESALASRVTIS